MSRLGRARPGTFLGRVARRLRALETRARYSFALLPAAPQNVRIAATFRHPIEVNGMSAGFARYLELFPESADREQAEAQRLLSHQFTYLGHTWRFDQRIHWSRDPVSGRDWSHTFSPDIIYRGPGRHGDIKLPWEFNKHQYFFTLGKAAWLGNPDAAPEIVQQIDAWITDNPYLSGVNWISALEAGTRAVSWMLAYPLFAPSCDPAFRERLTTSLARHMQFVEQHLSEAQFANTHLIGEAAALVVGGLFLDCTDSWRWMKRGLEILDREIDRQVTPDGVDAERSIAYHRFFLDHYYIVAALLAENGHALATRTLARMEQMTEFLMHVLFPDGTAPAFGDSDDARGLWLKADAPVDYRGLLALGAVLFDRGDFKQIAGGLVEEVLWLFGDRGIDKFKALAGRPPTATSTAFHEGGYYVMRNGWGAADSVLVFDCGPLGHGPAGHGHADALSFQLQTAGYTFLTDAGTFSYNLDYDRRAVFRGTRAHNTIALDGEDQSAQRDRMSWTTQARTTTFSWVASPWFDLVDGEHDGYRRLADPVTHRRAVLFVKPSVWLIWDRLTARGFHDAELLLHVKPDCGVEIAASGEAVQLTSPSGDRLYGWISGLSAGRFTLVDGADGDQAAWFSEAYGTHCASRMVSVKWKLRDGSGSDSIIGLSTSDSVRPVVTRHPYGISIALNRGPDVIYTLHYCTDGLLDTAADGVRFDGTALFRRGSGDSPAVFASRFRHLRLDGLLDIRSAALLESVVLENGRCHITTDTTDPTAIDFTSPERQIELLVNGEARRW